MTPVPISRTGNNALDFHLAFYLGYVAAKNPKGRLVLIANDKGHDPMIVHAKTSGFTAKRSGVIQILVDQVMHTAMPVPLSKNWQVVAASRCHTKSGSG